MFPTIGKARFTDFEAFKAWYIEKSKEWARYYWTNHFYNHVDIAAKETGVSDDSKYFCKAFDHLYEPSFRGWWSDATLEHFIKNIEKLNAFIEKNNQQWSVWYLNEEPNYMCIRYGASPENTFIIPDWEKYLSFVSFVYYEDMTVGDMNRLLTGSRGEEETLVHGSLIPANAPMTISKRSAQKTLSMQKSKITELEAEIKKVENAETESLAAIKREMERLELELKQKQETLMSELKVKMNEMTRMKRDMEKQIAMIDAQIYSIRCFLGETVDFVQLRQGKAEPIETPVILYQKIRYLDEDLGKFVITYPDEPIFDSLEDTLAQSDLMLDVFLPANKAISIVQLTKDSTRFYPNMEKNGNLLREYYDIHGHQLAILIRNGENLYIGWTDPDRMVLQSDNFFLTPKTYVEAYDEGKQLYESDLSYQHRMEAEQALNLQESLARHFLFQILNGVTASQYSILPLPKFHTPAARAKHIIFSYAENTLSDNRFGTLDDIIKKCNRRIRKGDHVITVQSLRPDQPRSSSGHWVDPRWSNDRGIGEKNRTHDCRLFDATIYPINLVTEDEPVQMTDYEFQIDKDRWAPSRTKGDGSTLSEGCRILRTYDYVREHYYVSAEKEYSPSDNARANFEVDKAEIWNLTYCASTYIEYILSNKSLGGFVVGSKKVNYTYILRHLGIALKFIKAREQEEARCIEAVGGADLLKDPDWPVALNEWKFNKSVRHINEYQAKRYVKSVASV